MSYIYMILHLGRCSSHNSYRIKYIREQLCKEGYSILHYVPLLYIFAEVFREFGILCLI